MKLLKILFFLILFYANIGHAKTCASDLYGSEIIIWFGKSTPKSTVDLILTTYLERAATDPIKYNKFLYYDKYNDAIGGTTVYFRVPRPDDAQQWVEGLRAVIISLKIDVQYLFLNGTLCFATSPPPSIIKLIEFQNTQTKHFFYSADRLEIAMIDNGGAGEGWVKTGEEIAVLSAESPDCYEAKLSYRFYSSIANSHFFTINRDECSALNNDSSKWRFENMPFSALPYNSNQPCKVPVYRLYNNRHTVNDANHRYTTKKANVEVMVKAGWVEEGVAFCAYVN